MRPVVYNTGVLRRGLCVLGLTGVSGCGGSSLVGGDGGELATGVGGGASVVAGSGGFDAGGGAGGAMGGGGQRIDGGGGAGESGGDAGVSYRGCTSWTAYDRVVIAKHDTTRDLCFHLILVSPPITEVPQGLTLPPRYGLEWANEGPGPFCSAQGGMDATQVFGTVEAGDAGLVATQVDVDVTLAFPINDAGVPATERLQVRDLDVGSGCPTPLAR